MNAHASTAPDLTSAELARLAAIAHRAVVDAVTRRHHWDPSTADEPAALRRDGAVFVTLRRGGALRGCIGTMTPQLPLALAAADRARAAAFNDPRFPPLGPDELDDLSVEVSVLTPMEPFEVGGYDALVATLRPGVDGVLVEAGRHRATFLPSVWEELPDATGWVGALWRKAGLPPRAWPDSIRTWRYRTQHS